MIHLNAWIRLCKARGVAVGVTRGCCDVVGTMEQEPAGKSCPMAMRIQPGLLLPQQASFASVHECIPAGQLGSQAGELAVSRASSASIVMRLRLPVPLADPDPSAPASAAVAVAAGVTARAHGKQRQRRLMVAKDGSILLRLC